MKVDLPERNDAHLKHVIINQQVDKKADAFRIEGVPFPFTSREQYERAMRQPLGREWNASNAFQELNKPEVKTRLGTIIDPINFIVIYLLQCCFGTRKKTACRSIENHFLHLLLLPSSQNRSSIG